MNMLNKILFDIDMSSEKLCEVDIYEILRNIKQDNFLETEAAELQFELFAFGFTENYNWSNWVDGGWGTYFGPMMVFPNGDGTSQIFPHRDQITPTIIDYWLKRLSQITHSVLKARYAGLIWNFNKCATGNKPPVEIAYIRIDSINEMANKRLHKYEIEELSKLKHALTIALSIKDRQRVDMLKNTILNYEKNVVKSDAAVGAWSISYELLLENKKIKLSKEEEDGIINRIQGRLDRLIDFSTGHAMDTYPIKEAAVRLAKYHNRKNESEKVKAILSKYIDAVYQQANLGSPLQSYSWLNEAFQIIKIYNLKDEMDMMVLKLQEISANLYKDMHLITIETKIDQKEVENFINKMTEGDIETCLRRLVFNYMPCKYEIEQEVKELAKANPISYNISRIITDPKGRPVATIGEIDNDLEGHIIWQAGQNIHLNKRMGIMRVIVEKIILQHKVSVDLLINYLYKSPLFSVEKKEIIKSGVQAYLNGDSVSAIHVLIPQVEEAIRNILDVNKLPIYKQNSDGGYNLKVLDELLHHRVVIDTLGEDVVFYFRVLFTDQRGLCMRHSTCHGLAIYNQLKMVDADLVFHALLILSEIKLAQ